MTLNESIIEDATLTWFGELGYAVGYGPHIAPGELAAERDLFSEVVLVERLRDVELQRQYLSVLRHDESVEFGMVKQGATRGRRMTNTALGPPRSPAAKPKLEPKPAPTPPKKSDEIVRKKGK